MKSARHGDLILNKVEVDISTMKKIASKQFVLAEGETTGHKHVVTADVGTVDIYKNTAGEIFLVIDGKAVVTHEEHNKIELPSGTYKLGHQQEYDYFALSTIKVQD